MIKVLILLIVLAFSAQDSHEYYDKVSYIGNLVVQETAIAIAAAKVPSPAIVYRKQGKNKVFHFIAPKMENLIGRIDQWEYGRI